MCAVSVFLEITRLPPLVFMTPHATGVPPSFLAAPSGFSSVLHLNTGLPQGSVLDLHYLLLTHFPHVISYPHDFKLRHPKLSMWRADHLFLLPSSPTLSSGSLLTFAILGTGTTTHGTAQPETLHVIFDWYSRRLATHLASTLEKGSQGK